MKRFVLGVLLSMLATTSAQAQGWAPGDWVLAQWRGGQYWFPGIVERNSGSSVTVLFDDGSRETRPANQVKNYNWRIGSNIQCIWASDGEWYSAVITGMGDDGESLRIRYTDDGTVEKTKTGKCRSR